MRFKAALELQELRICLICLKKKRKEKKRELRFTLK